MNYSETKKELKKEFERFLKPLGFKPKNDVQGCEFYVIKKNQILRLGYGVSNYIDEFYTTCYSKISLIPIQRVQVAIFNEDGIYDTLTNSIAMYLNEINFRYKIKTVEDIKAWGEIAQNFYEASAIPFFEKYDSVDALDILVNLNPSEKVKYCENLYWHSMNGLISAKLNNNPNYRDLRSYYKNEIENTYKGGHFNFDKFKKVIEFLDSHSREELVQIAEAPI